MITTEQNLTLFQITRDRVTLEAVLEELGGEITPEMEEALKINQEQLSTKAESYIVILEQLHAYIEFNKRYKEQAERNIERAEKSMERLKSNLLDAAKLYGSFEAGIHRVGTRKSQSVVIEDEEALPVEFVNLKVVRTPDKKKIGEAIKGGKTVEGASLKTNLNLKIS